MRLLLVGRFHALTAAQLRVFVEAAAAPDVREVIAVLTAADQAGTRRNPLPVSERRALLAEALRGLPRPVRLVELVDLPDGARWAATLAAAVARETGAAFVPAEARVLTVNPSIATLLGALGCEVQQPPIEPPTPAELVERCACGRPWEADAAPAVVAWYRAHGVPERLARLHGSTPAGASGELAEGRDYRSYGRQMDAALQAKLADLAPHVRPGRIFDLGCGTGAMLEALSWRHPESAFVGVDGSRDLLAIAEAQTFGAGDVRFVRGDVVEPPGAPGEATTVIFSSVLHEVHSYGGYSRARVRQALAAAVRLLAPGGRLLLRDGVRPALEDEVRLTCREDDASPLGSTRDRFLRFAREFKGGPPVGGIPYREDGRSFQLVRPDAAEFLSKKDYVEHWALEVREEFGVFPLAGWTAELQALGLHVVHAAEYVSPWIRAHRFEGFVSLEARGPDGAWQPTDFPATHFVLAAERR